MHEFFNPAGLEISEDPTGAVAYGFIAPRVLYARFVGELSAGLGSNYVERLSELVTTVPSLAYFADASALSGYEGTARAHFLRFVLEQRKRLAAIVMLTWSGGITPAARAFASAVGEPIALLDDPAEFDRLLANVVPELRRAPPVGEVLELHQPLPARQ
jgi:hypothetical protein